MNRKRMAIASPLRPPGHEPGEAPSPTHFSLSPELIRSILRHARPLGHHEVPHELNLGFGFLYYALVRALRPRHVLVIGSGFGFSVVCLALGLKDNAKGRLSFVDPSYSLLTDGPLKTVGGTSQWSDPQRVQRHFARFGVEKLLTHYRMRSEEFFARYAELKVPEIDLAFIDGSHAYGDVKQDFLSTLRRSGRNAYLLLHDTNIYIRELVRHAGVKRWLKAVKRNKDAFELVDFPFSSGVAIVRVLVEDAWKCLESPRSS
jgi:predicted O-methyltransferase YrrM